MKAVTPKQDALERLQEGIAQLTTSQAWTSYLKVQSRFYRYSHNNCILIWRQMPEASRVAGYRRWQELGRQVRKGERGIMILAPCKYKVDDRDRDGEEQLVIRGFRTANVFDISQTDGEALPDLPISRLSGDAPAVMDALTGYARELGYTVGFEAFDQEAKNGQTNFGSNTITLREGLSPAQTVKTMVHELGHVLLSHLLCELRSVAELEAESTAFVVCDALGIDSGTYSFAYVAHWGNGANDAIESIKSSAQRIQQAANRILEALNVDGGTP
jgi:antirestriction protein ArdC